MNSDQTSDGRKVAYNFCGGALVDAKIREEIQEILPGLAFIRRRSALSFIAIWKYSVENEAIVQLGNDKNIGKCSRMMSSDHLSGR